MEGNGNLQRSYDERTIYGMHFHERRHSPRYDTKDGIVTIAGVHVNAATTRLLNVSRQGLAFAHISPLPLQEKVLEVNLLVIDQKGGDDLFLHKAGVEILSIEDISGSWGRRGGSARRYGLRFVGITPQQQYSLLQFFGSELQRSGMLLPPELLAH